MSALILVFLLGCVAGLRSLSAPAIVCWAAHFGWLHLVGTRLAFMNHPATLIIFTALAALELVADKLPKTPARTAPIGLSARVVLGGLSGAATAAGSSIIPYLGAAAGCIGSLVGAFAGYHVRRTLVVRRQLPDFSVALTEDLIAIVGGLLITRLV
jgi:uncharacterized membrane protein